MELSERNNAGDHEQVVFCRDPSVGYRGIIAIHDTALGPAVGGTRFWNYADEEEALNDALRLSRGMTYKNALAGLPFVGGKSIIIGDNRTLKREEIFRAHGRFVETFGGRYITAEDVGTSTSDMEYVRLETDHVAGLIGRSGDPSPATAKGVFRALQAAARYRWGSDEVSGRTIAVQGCGNVGYHLCGELHHAGAKLIITDIEPARVQRIESEFNATRVQPEEIYGVAADIFAPCALGGIINDKTVPQLNVEIVVGAANNQLLEIKHGDMLEDRGILYAPDYVANAGGIINGCIELLGWEPSFSFSKIQGIYDTLLSIFEIAKVDRIPTYRAADRLAEHRLAAARGHHHQ
ncbi:MAG: Leu/Phe/Val dehydrogenase [Pyrinomonadaceae bacterium]